MTDNLRRLDDPSNYVKDTTLLTLPLSDFPNANKNNNAASSSSSISINATSTNISMTPTNDEMNENETSITRDDDDLILISLGDDGIGLTMDDLIRGKSVYILGDTSERDIRTNLDNDNGTTTLSKNLNEDDDNKRVGVGGSIEPVAARLIVEGCSRSGNSNSNSNHRGKTMELTRVETSNTYIVVPPMPRKEGDTVNTNHKNKNNNATNDGSNKRQKSDGSNTTKNIMIAMPARSIGLVPGEDSPSCFFLDPAHLNRPGHFASKLRATLGRYAYDPFDPPPPLPLSSDDPNSTEKEEGGDADSSSFGYTLSELAHVCRTSRSEIEYAICNRVYGAEDALAIPSSYASSSPSSPTRYGMLSEEGRQTVAMAIASTLLESDLELAWEFPPASSSSKGKQAKLQGKGMRLAPLVEEVRCHWQNSEGVETSSHRARVVQNPYKQSQKSESQSQFGTPSQLTSESELAKPTSLQLAEEVIWHCLRPILRYGDTTSSTTSTTTSDAPAKGDAIPERAHLLPDEVAKLAAHHAFLRGTPKNSQSSSSSSSSSHIPGGASANALWDEDELTEAWSMRLPSMSSRYEPRMELLRGIALSEISKEEGVNDDDAGADAQDDAETTVRRWRYFPEEGLPLVPSARMRAMFAVQTAWTVGEAAPYLEKFVEVGSISRGVVGGDDATTTKGGSLESLVAELLGRHAKVMRATEKRGGDGKEGVTVVKYVAI